MAGRITVPEDLTAYLPAFPAGVQARLRTLQQARGEARTAGNPVIASRIEVSIRILAIFFLPEEVLLQGREGAACS